MTPLLDLIGKVAVVTGSSRGIGRAIAERLAEHGARVVVSSRSRDTAVFLAAPASSFMTGQTLVIDGGVTAGSASVET